MFVYTFVANLARAYQSYVYKIRIIHLNFSSSKAMSSNKELVYELPLILTTK